MRLRARFFILLVLPALAILLAAGQVRADRLAGVDAAGELDAGFGSGGVVTTDYGETTTANAVAVQSDGKIVVAGTAVGPSIAVMRLNPDGSRDLSFSNDGLVTSVGDTQAHAVGLQQDGKIVVAGEASRNFIVERYNPDGTLDASFGERGRRIHSFARDSIDVATSLVLLPGGKIIAAGYTTALHDTRYTGVDFALARYNTDGTLDTSFDGDGLVITPISESEDKIWGAAAAPAGDVVVTGQGLYGAAGSADWCMVLARYNPDGSLDSGFDGDGMVSNCTTAFLAVAVQPDGRIVSAGVSGSGFILTRYEASGRVDSGFGEAGFVVVDFGMGRASARAVVIQPDGKLVVGGDAGVNPSERFALARLLPDGRLDPTFGSGGKVLTPILQRSAARALALQQDGKVVAAGWAGSSGGPLYAFAVARYQGSAVPGCIFSDVCASDYFFTPVQELVRRGAISGYGDNTFRPFNNTTRGQLAKIVVAAEGWPLANPATPTFRDVPAGSAFFRYVETAAARGVVGGYADGTYRPFADVTRGQLAKIVVTARGWPLLNPATPRFADVPRENAFYTFIETAAARGVISGYDDRTFRWANNATRGQIAKIVYQAVTSGEN